ncbi:BapA/Bap/LapF family large adhesin, partial [Pectobacterium sp. B1J-3]|uniref:BapA/Bap/LapF family large adhesin n=1 Tax=Pectobacterium sp. B1J-3 TaxID=3385371 RepID=UPI003906C66B
TAEAPDTTAPAVPTDVEVAEDGTSVSGNAEPGSTVTLTDANGNVLGEATAGEDGSFTVPLNPALTNGETVNVIATDPAGNSSDPVIAEAPDMTAPAVPTDVEVAEDGTSVSGNAEPGSTVTLTDADGNTLGETTVGEDGSFTVPLNPPLTNGETVNVVVTDPAGNSSGPVIAEAPDTTAPAVPTDVEVAEDGTSVSGNAEPGSTVTLTDANGNVLGEATAGEDGSFTVPLNPALTNGETVNVIATDPAGNSSDPVIAEAPDMTAPAVPTDVEVAEDGTSVSGNAEPGSTVTLTDADGNTLGETTVGEDGSFTVPLNPPLTNGETVNVVVTDPAGNSSDPVTAEAPDTTAPAVPTDVEVAEDGTSVSGNAEPGSTVTLTDADGNTLGETTVGEDGSFTVPLDPPLTNGETVNVVVTDPAGNSSDPITAEAPDTTPPDMPHAYLNEAGTALNGTAEPGSTVTVTLPDDTIITATATDNGTWSISLPDGLEAGTQLDVTATDAAGNTSPSYTVTVPDTSIPDTTPPEAPEAVVSADGLTVSGNAEPGSTVSVTLPNGTVLVTTPDEYGVYSVTLPTALLNGETVTVTATDAAGNTSEVTSAIAPDTTAPAVPTDVEVAEDGTSVSGNAEPGSTVTLTDADGNALGEVTVGEDGSFTVPLNPPLTNGETVNVVVTDPAGNSSDPITAEAPDTTAPAVPTDVEVADDGTSVSGNAEPGSTVTLTDSDGNALGEATAGEDGSFTVPLDPPLTNGETVNVVVTDPAGNSSDPITAEAPDTTPPDMPHAYLNEAGTALNGTAEPGSTITVTLPDDTTLTTTAAENGTWSVTLPAVQEAGTQLDVTATDATGNISPSYTVTVPDTSIPDTTPPEAPEAVVSADGLTVSGDAEPGSTVSVTLPNGTVLITTPDEFGVYSVTLPTALLNGETVTVTATDAAGNTSEVTSAIAPDTTAPAVPIDVEVAEDGASVSGNAEPGSTVTLTDANGNVLGDATAGEDGSFSISLSPALTNGENVTAVATDAAGNSSTPATATAPDTTAPAVPTDVEVAEDGTSVSGNAEPGSTVTLTDANGNELGEAIAGEDGSFTVPLDPPLTNGETVNAVATDGANNSSAPATTNAPDTTAPLPPTNLSVAEGGVSVSGNAEPGSTVTLTDADGNALGEATAGEDGSFTVLLDPPLTNGEAVNAVATDGANNSSTPATTNAPDTTAPAVPTDVEVAEDGTSVSGSAEPGSTVTLTDANGNELGEAIAGEDGSFTVPLDPPLTNGETVNVVVTDPAGNSSDPVTAEAPDTTAPAVPTDVEVTEDGTSVTGDAEPGSTVTLTDADGNTLGETTVGEDGSFTVPLNPPLTNGETVNVVVTDPAGNSSDPVTAEAPDTTPPDMPHAYLNETGTALNGTAEPGSTVTVTLPGNPPLMDTVADNGTWSISLPEGLEAGTQLDVTATDAAGNTSPSYTVTVPDTSIPDTTAPEAPEAVVSADGLTVSGDAEPGSTVSVTLPNGTVLITTPDEFGVYSVTLPTALLNGETVTVTATDAAGNTSEVTSAIAPDTTAPAVPIDVEVAEDGASVSGNAEPGSTVTLTDANGNVLGDATAGEDGSFSISLSPALTNGENVTAVATDAAGNSSTPATATAPDTTAPAVPTDVEVADDGASVSGNAEPGSTVTLTDANGNELGEAIAGEDGSFTVPLSPALINGETVTAIATDPSGNSSASITVTAPVMVLEANDNAVLLDLVTEAEVTSEQYSDWGVLVVGALGNIISLLGDDSAQVNFTVDSGASADMVLDASATGGVLSLLSTMGVIVQQYDTTANSWNTIVNTSDPQWASLLTIGSNSVTLNLEGLGEGAYRAIAYNTTLLAVGSFTNITATVTQTGAGVVSGETIFSGNVITDVDSENGSDVAPVGTVVTQVENGTGDVVEVTQDGTSIQGEYGTLSINLDGSYTYTLTNTSPSVLGQTDSFTYTISVSGVTATANLNVSLGEAIDIPASNVVVTDDSASITYETTVDTIDNGTSSQGGFTLINVGLGRELNVGILDDLASPIIFDVEEGTVRTMTLQSSVAGLSAFSEFDLYIYKFNNATQQYEQHRVEEGWLKTTLVLGSSEELTLTLEGGRYLFLLDTVSGISVVTGYTLDVLEDHVYTVETVSANTTGNVMDDDIAPEGSVISTVNGVTVVADGTTSISGEYGVLMIDAQGNYSYTLNAGLGADSITAPDSFVYTVTAPDGESDTGTLNVELIPSGLTAVDDSVALPATAANEETPYIDSNAGTASWTTLPVVSSSGSAEGSITVADDTILKDAVITFDVDTALGIGSLNISWSLVDGSGEEIRTGVVNSSSLINLPFIGIGANIPLTGLELAAGDYTLRFTGSIGALGITVGNVTIAASVAGTSILLDDFLTETAAVEGNLFDGSGSESNSADQLVSVDTVLSIVDADNHVITLDPRENIATATTVEGKYGVLTLEVNGDYRYELNANVNPETITEKETFTYTLTTEGEGTAEAVLTIDLALQLNGSRYNDTATSSAYDDTFTLGDGKDTLIFKLLDPEGVTGGNGSDTWTDFSLADGDRIDVSALLQGWDSESGNLGDWISVDIVDGNTVIAIDRDGQGSAFESAELVTLQSVQVTLEELLESNAITA